MLVITANICFYNIFMKFAKITINTFVRSILGLTEYGFIMSCGLNHEAESSNNDSPRIRYMLYDIKGLKRFQG